MIAFPCPKCNATLKAPEERAGAHTKCPYCTYSVQVPSLIRFACPACKSVLECPDRKAGSKIACLKCGQRLQIPSPPRGGQPAPNKTVLGALVATFLPHRTSPPGRANGAPVGPATSGRLGKAATWWRGLTTKAKAGVVGGSALAALSCLLCCGLGGQFIFNQQSQPAKEIAQGTVTDPKPKADPQTDEKPKPDEKPKAEEQVPGKGVAPKGDGGAKIEPGQQPHIKGGDVGNIFHEYKDNEAAADAKYLNKQVQFQLSPDGIAKEADGVYYAWMCIVDTRTNQHVKCYFRKDQVAKLAGVQGRQRLMIRGTCVGTKGRSPTLVADVVMDYPVVVFIECELVK